MRRWFLIPVFSLLFYSFTGFDVVFASSVIFSDGFENGFSEWTGNDEKWTTSGTSVPNGIKSGEKRGEVKGNTEPGDDVLLKNISTSGNEGVVFEFWYRIKESLEDDDHMYVEWTADSSNWNILNNFTAVAKSDAWVFVSHTLPAEADDKANFAVRFRAHLGAATSDVFYLDDVIVSVSGASSAPMPISIISPSPTLSPSLEPTASPSVIPTPFVSETPMPTPVKTFAPPSPATRTPIPIETSIPAMSSTSTKSPKSPAPSPADVSIQKSGVSSQEELIASESSGSLEAGELSEKSEEISESSNILPASIFRLIGARSFWLLGLMIAAVVISLAKFKKE